MALPSKGGAHTLPIVPQKFEFKPRDESAGRALELIGNLMAQARQPVVATDAEREGELIAYEVICGRQCSSGAGGPHGTLTTEK